jgi:GPH family glycoside/pentoside/hexuronide:cation symporter/glucuronide carrier protein
MATSTQPIPAVVPVDIAQEKIKFGEKLAFVMMQMGNTPVIYLASTFLMIFYTDVVHLDPTAVATLFLVSRIVDACYDPVMGYILGSL